MPPTPDALDHLRRRPTVTVPEAAEVLGVSRETAYKWAREGHLPGAMRLGTRAIRVRTSDLLAVLEPGDLEATPARIANGYPTSNRREVWQ